jgi:hypothetical protein
MAVKNLLKQNIDFDLFNRNFIRITQLNLKKRSVFNGYKGPKLSF